MSQCTVRKDLSILGKSQACTVQPQNREIERKNESNHFNACWGTQFVLLCDVLILCDLLHVGVNVSLFKDSEDYELTFAMTFVIQCSLLHPRGRNSFLDKINVTLTCTGNLKLSTAILLLVKVGPLVCSRELNLSGMFLVLLVPHFWPILKCNVWIL